MYVCKWFQIESETKRFVRVSFRSIQFLTKLSFQGVFWNPLDKPIQKLSFGIQFHQDLMEKTKEQADAK